MILTAKVTVPALPGWIVPRARVDRLITAGARGPVTVLTGPPGAGKTMALASWASRPANAPVAWVALDEYDNRPGTFWSHIIEALRRAGVDVPSGGYQEAGAAVAFVRRLAAALVNLDRDVALVLDDLHQVTAPECLDGIEYLARYAGRLHVLAASRMDPLLHLQRLRVSGQLTEIRARELAFTVGEAGELIAQHHIDLPPAALELLTRRSQGWAAGLRLAALSMREHPDPGRVVDQFAAADGPVTGYLVNEVLDRQPADVRRLMLYTSVTDRMCAELARELSGGIAPTATWPALARANAFVQPAGDGWFRYYPPLGEVLRLKLQEELPQEVRPLRIRAASWLKSHGRLAEAVGLAATAGDWQCAARMIVDELAVGQLIDPRAGYPLADALDAPPANLDPADAHSLAIAAAIGTRRHRDGEAGRLLQAAADALVPVPADAQLPARLAAATIAVELARRSGNLAAAQAAAEQARDVLSRMPAALLESRADAHAQVLAAIGFVAMWADRFDDATTALGRSAETGGGSGWPADGTANLALVEAIQGRLGQAGRLAAEAERDGAGAAAAVALAWVRLERGQLTLAQAALAHAERDLDARPDKIVGALAHVVTARYLLAKGRPRQAAETARADRVSWTPPAWLDQMLAAAEVRGLTETGDTRRAVDTAAGTADPELTPALARALLARGEPVRASQAVATAKAASARRGWRPGRVATELAAAELAYASGDAVHGRRSLQAALRLAEPEQMRLPFTLERAWIQPVLSRDSQLAAAFHRALGTRSAGMPPEAVRAARLRPVVVEELSGREREVLGYVSQMLSTAEIAAEMYLSVNTVKSHVRTILRKLGAGHRREAVRRARELQLL